MDQNPQKPFIIYLIDKFTTREHFMRAITTLILVVAAYQSLTVGEIEDHWLILVGTVIGYYFKMNNMQDSH